MTPVMAVAVAAVPAFLASLVEFVEAFTIVLAVGNTRGWRSPLWGVAGALVTLAFVVGVLGTPLILFHDQISQWFHLAVGVLLLLFGMRWLRKAILRFVGIVPLHDEEQIYRKEVAELLAQGLGHDRWDNVGFWFSFKAVLLEGLEVAFIVVTLATQGEEALTAALLGATAAFAVVLLLGLALRHPLTLVPENWMKFVVGVMLTTFGVFWGSEGLLVEWPWQEGTLLVLLGLVVATSVLAVLMLRSLLGSRLAEVRVGRPWRTP